MTGVVQISEAVSLAMHGMGLLAVSGRRMRVKEMAQRVHVSEAHLAKVFQRLVKAGLVESTRGPMGGFELSRDPSEIDLLEIYQSIEGHPKEGYCLIKGIECPFRKCIFGGTIAKMTEEFMEYLKNTNLGELVGSGSE